MGGGMEVDLAGPLPKSDSFSHADEVPEYHRETRSDFDLYMRVRICDAKIQDLGINLLIETKRHPWKPRSDGLCQAGVDNEPPEHCFASGNYRCNGKQIVGVE